MKAFLSMAMAFLLIGTANAQPFQNPCINSIGQTIGDVAPVMALDFYSQAASAPGPPLTLYVRSTTYGTMPITPGPSVPPAFLPRFWLDGSVLRGAATIYLETNFLLIPTLSTCYVLPSLPPGDYSLDLELTVILPGFTIDGRQRVTGAFTVGPAQPIPADSPIALLILALGLVAIPLLRTGWGKGG